MLFAKDLKEVNKITSDAKSVILLDYNTNRILFQKNSIEVYPPASLTKLITIYTALIEATKNNVGFKTLINISENASYYNAPPHSSLMFVEKGQIVNFGEILKGLAIPSGNDAAVAVAEFFGAGSIYRFINIMNINLLNLGLLKTHFVGTSGYSEYNKTTAYEMAIFTKKYIDKFPFMLDIHSLENFVYPRNENLGSTLPSRVLNLEHKNRNLLISEYPYADGLKTGYIDEIGFNLAATAKKGERRLIAIVLGVERGYRNEGDRKRAFIAKTLFEYGFNEFEEKKIMIKLNEKVYNGTLEKALIYSKDPFVYTFSKDEFDRINIGYNVKELVAPINKDQKVGCAFIYLDNNKIGELDLFSEKVSKVNLFQKIYRFFSKFFRRE